MRSSAKRSHSCSFRRDRGDSRRAAEEVQHAPPFSFRFPVRPMHECESIRRVRAGWQRLPMRAERRASQAPSAAAPFASTNERRAHSVPISLSPAFRFENNATHLAQPTPPLLPPDPAPAAMTEEIKRDVDDIKDLASQVGLEMKKRSRNSHRKAQKRMGQDTQRHEGRQESTGDSGSHRRDAVC